MSRYYRMDIEISEFDSKRIDEITDAASEEWPDWETWDHITGTKYAESLSCSGKGNLCGGESEEAFASRICLAVWKANKGYCNVVVTETCLENIPRETYSGTKEQYDKAFGKGKKGK